LDHRVPDYGRYAMPIIPAEFSGTACSDIIFFEIIQIEFFYLEFVLNPNTNVVLDHESH
jgi:hypothetical protein